MDDNDIQHLRRCVELATEALDAGDEPFGSLLTGPDGAVLAEDRNRVGAGDPTRHPEFELARWSVRNLSPTDRALSTVYTSGEHCPMCSAAHAWVGLGRIVYASSSVSAHAVAHRARRATQPVASLSINEVAPGVQTDGPAPDLAEDVRALHVRFLGDA